MDFDQLDLRLFSSIAQLSNITRAAETQHLSLPAASVRIRALEEHVGAFLFTDVSREGLLGGFDVTAVEPVRRATARQLIVAGGIRSVQEIDDLHAMGIDAVVGMAIYTTSFPLTSDF